MSNIGQDDETMALADIERAIKNGDTDALQDIFTDMYNEQRAHREMSKITADQLTDLRKRLHGKEQAFDAMFRMGPEESERLGNVLIAARNLHDFLSKVVGSPDNNDALAVIIAEVVTAEGIRVRLENLGRAINGSDVRDEYIDYQAWALDMCGLLDAIEKAIGDNEIDRADNLVSGRFDIAVKHGLKTAPSGTQTSGLLQ